MSTSWLENKSWHRIRNEMLLSPAWKAASHLQQSMVFALVAELGRHSGKDNGSLIFTNTDFEEFGFSRCVIKPNLSALVALGFIAMKAGRPGLKGYGKARRYRLTFMPMLDADGKEIEPPTDEWARFTTTKDAQAAVQRAKKRAQVVKTGVEIEPLDSSAEIEPLSPETQPVREPEKPINIELACIEIEPLSTSMLATSPLPKPPTGREASPPAQPKLTWATPTVMEIRFP
jgi:hypothetical protein